MDNNFNDVNNFNDLNKNLDENLGNQPTPAEPTPAQPTPVEPAPQYAQPPQPMYNQPNQQYTQPPQPMYNQQTPPYYGNPQFPQNAPQYVQPQQKDNSKGLAVASLVLGILSFFSCGQGIILSVLGFIFGMISISKQKHGNGLAIAGIVISVIAFFVLLFLIIAVSEAGSVSEVLGIYNSNY